MLGVTSCALTLAAEARIVATDKTTREDLIFILFFVFCSSQQAKYYL
jgi:hypothetical protein